MASHSSPSPLPPPRRARLRPLCYVGHSLTPRTQAVGGRPQLMVWGGGWAAPPVPGPLSRGGPGRATVRLGLGKLWIVRGHGAMGRGAHPPSSPPGPAPCRCLCGAELPAPGPAEACCPPRPGASLTSQGQEPVLPGMPGSSQRTLFPRGSGSPRILSILLLGRRAGPLPAPIFVSLSHRAHIGPLPTAFAILCDRGRQAGKVKDKGKAHGRRVPSGKLWCASPHPHPGLRESLFL